MTLKIASGAETFEPVADIRSSEAPVIFGRYCSVDALVEHGDARGRTLGFPTANMHLPEDSPLAFGVYAVRVGIFAEGKLGPVHNGVANFGIRPMYRISRLLSEVHVLDFDGDLYDKILRVQFVAYLRPESAFTGVEALIEKIGEDAHKARECLRGHREPLAEFPHLRDHIVQCRR